MVELTVENISLFKIELFFVEFGQFPDFLVIKAIELHAISVALCDTLRKNH